MAKLLKADRKKIHKFLTKVNEQTVSNISIKLLKEYGLSKRQLENLINNGYDNYSKTFIDNITRFFIGCLLKFENTRGMSLEGIKEQGIKENDFIAIAKKLEIPDNFINPHIKDNLEK